MKPTTRNVLSFAPLVLQFLAMTSAYGMTTFLSKLVAVEVKEHVGKVIFPAPALLLANHPGVAKLILIGLFAISAVCFFVSRSRMNEESDQLAFQGTVFGVVWLVGVNYAGAVIMAAVVAYLAANPPH